MHNAPSPLIRRVRLLWRNARFFIPGFPRWGGAVRQAQLTHLFREVNHWLRDAEVEYWLTYGTLLGFFREGAILYHDRDIDFALPNAAYPRLLACADKLPPGFRLCDTSSRHHGPKLYVDYRGWEADLYFYRPDGTTYRSLLRSNTPNETFPLPMDAIHPIQTARFLDEPVCVPGEVKAYLTHLYGYLGADARYNRRTGYYEPRKTKSSHD